MRRKTKLIALSLFLLGECFCRGEMPPAELINGLDLSALAPSYPADGTVQILSLKPEGDGGIATDNKEMCSANPVIMAPEGYALVWNDEFDIDPKDSGKWRFEDWAPGRVNNELQRYVAGGEKGGKKTAQVIDGVLHITAMQHNDEVISARMNSTNSWQYGYMEARIKLPKGKGTWPAFWMMPDDQHLGWPSCGEIDIMEEVGVKPNYTSSSIHTKSYNHVIKTQKTKEIYTTGAEDEFHVYACEWTAESIKFYTDGKQFFEFKNDGNSNNDTWPFNKTFYIILNLAWGGSWGGMNGVDPSALPITMEVDYVRVFQKL